MNENAKTVWLITRIYDYFVTFVGKIVVKEVCSIIWYEKEMFKEVKKIRTIIKYLMLDVVLAIGKYSIQNQFNQIVIIAQSLLHAYSKKLYSIGMIYKLKFKMSIRRIEVIRYCTRIDATAIGTRIEDLYALNALKFKIFKS